MHWSYCSLALNHRYGCWWHVDARPRHQQPLYRLSSLGYSDFTTRRVNTQCAEFFQCRLYIQIIIQSSVTWHCVLHNSDKCFADNKLTKNTSQLTLTGVLCHIWGLWCQKHVSQAWISNCIPQNTVGCNYWSMHKDTCIWHQSPHMLWIFCENWPWHCTIFTLIMISCYQKLWFFR